jgi:peptidyl-prolyl cis-trans isomerase A (cyclophilin A)
MNMATRTRKIQGSLAAALLMALPAMALADDDPMGGKFTIDEATHGLSGSGRLIAVIDTTKGVFHCELFEKDAPNTVANFVGLARGLRPFREPSTQKWLKRPFYDGLVFHRVIPGFMIQGGDVTGTGAGQIGYEILDETNDPHKFNQGGMMAMANRGRNTGSSQFFITEKEQPALDDGGRAGGHYQIFGQCPEVNLVKDIAAVSRDPRDRPLQDVKINKVTIERESGSNAATPQKPKKQGSGSSQKKVPPPPG